MMGIMLIVLAAVAVVMYAVSRRVGKVNEYPVAQ
jgi:Na+-transporting methylmalonyl-CoA/oxaloacetate decarboxylase gamma subunit